MKRILIFSDTHGYTDPCIELIRSTPRVNAVIHAGDCTRDAEDLGYIFTDIPIYYVKGNNDLLSRAPSEMSMVIEGAKVFITHGHMQNVKYEYRFSTLRSHVSAIKPDLVIFGHTHTPYTSYDDGVILLNPGSVKNSKTYAVAEIENGRVNTRILEF